MSENGMTITRTPEAVGAEIRSLTATAKKLTLYFGIEIGRRLAEARELVPHGEWLAWLERETEFSQPTASRFVRLYQEYGADQQSLFGAEAKYSTLNNLSISNALRLLAVPEEEREAFAAGVDAEHISSRELDQAIRERDEARKKLEEEREVSEGASMRLAEAEEQRDAARETVRDLKEREKTFRQELAEAEKELETLRNRPVEVAVQRDEQAIADAVKEAERLAAKTLADVKKNAKAAETDAKKKEQELQTRIKDLVDKLAKAQEATKDAPDRERQLAQAKAEISELQKRVAMSGAEVAAARILFTSWQEAFARLRTAVQAAPEEAKGRLWAAIKTQAETWAQETGA